MVQGGFAKVENRHSLQCLSIELSVFTLYCWLFLSACA